MGSGLGLIAMTTEVVCPHCGAVSLFRHMESHNSPAKLVYGCVHGYSWKQDGAEITVDFKQPNPHMDHRKGAIATIAVVYGEFQSDYSAVVVRYGNGKSREMERFDSGDVEKDFLAAAQFAHSKSEVVLLSSSCDNFVYDGEDYGWRISEHGEVIYKLTEDQSNSQGEPEHAE